MAHYHCWWRNRGIPIPRLHCHPEEGGREEEPSDDSGEGFTQGDPVQDEGGKFIEDGLGQCTSGVPYTPEMIQ